MPTEPIESANNSRALIPGSRGFTLVLAIAIGMTALAIDSILPAFDEIRADFGLAPGSTDVAALVTIFMVGLGLGQVPAGLLADRYGRRPVLWGGIALYIVGAGLSMIAPSLTTLMIARLLWGLGAAGPRVAVTAMVRDSFSGTEMARQMSTIMAVFLIIPMVAPSIGAVLLKFGPWQLPVAFCIVVAVCVLGLSTRLPATMPPGSRREISPGELYRSWRIVLTTPGSLPYLVAITAMTGAFMSYISSSENIVGETFGLESWFALVFATTSIGLALGNVVNGRIVRRVGIDAMLRVLPAIQLSLAVALVAFCVATSGRPPFGVFLVLITALLMSQQITMVNTNSAAMVPLGHIAGAGAAVFGMIPTVGGALLAMLIDSRFQGSLTPLAMAFLAAATITVVTLRSVQLGAQRAVIEPEPATPQVACSV